MDDEDARVREEIYFTSLYLDAECSYECKLFADIFLCETNVHFR